MSLLKNFFAFVFVVFFVSFSPFSLGQVSDAKSGNREQDYFKKYSIPKPLQNEDMRLFLKRMDWFRDAARQDNWYAATAHPARFGKYCDWSRIRLHYYFDTEGTAPQYHLSSLVITHGTGSRLTRDARFEGCISFYADGQVRFYQSILWDLSFGLKDDEDHEFNEFFCPKLYGLEDNPMKNDTVKWDNSGKIFFDDNSEKFEDFWKAVLFNSDLDYLADVKDCDAQNRSESACPPITLTTKNREPNNPLQLPHEKRYEKLIKPIIDCYEVLESGKVSGLITAAGFNSKKQYDPEVVFRFNKNSVFDVAIVQPTGVPYREFGKYMLFDENGLSLWLDGDLYELKGPDSGYHSLPLELQYKISGSGTEVKFHKNGYPAGYKTIANNRLFGRQIEWNDQGEVISDVDLDIPKPWVDASNPLLNQPEPVVMRTWTSRDGKFSVQAKYLSADETTVTIEKENGKRTAVEISKLSEPDQKYIERQRDAKKQPEK
jgi:hypothetical protein